MTEATPRKKTARAVAIPLLARPLKLWQDDPMTQEVRIEIIPLIDVIFCILTFFILAAVGLSRQQAISLNLPKASTGTPQMREMLVVSLDDFGQLYLEKQRVNQDQLAQAIENYYKLSPNGLMVLNASKNASYNNVIEVLDLLRKVGGDRVSLATLPGESQKTENLNNYPSNLPVSPSGAQLPGSPSGTQLPVSPSGAQLPGNSLNPVQPNYPLNPTPGLNNSPSNQLTSPLPPVPNAPNSTPGTQ